MSTDHPVSQVINSQGYKGFMIKHSWNLPTRSALRHYFTDQPTDQVINSQGYKGFMIKHSWNLPMGDFQ